jgi:ribosomal protein S18 acetylase RimI-like enzyme
MGSDVDVQHTADSGADPRATIRRAVPAEAPFLSDLAFRSKAYWGYDEAFMAACRDDLTIAPEEIIAEQVHVLEARDRILGFYQVRKQPDAADLADLWVDPDAMRRGHGRRLFQHAAATAAHLGFQYMTIQSDPHAEAFYAAMGAVRIGEAPSTVFPDRQLPLLIFSLASFA